MFEIFCLFVCLFALTNIYKIFITFFLTRIWKWNWNKKQNSWIVTSLVIEIKINGQTFQFLEGL